MQSYNQYYYYIIAIITLRLKLTVVIRGLQIKSQNYFYNTKSNYNCINIYINIIYSSSVSSIKRLLDYTMISTKKTKNISDLAQCQFHHLLITWPTRVKKLGKQDAETDLYQIKN